MKNLTKLSRAEMKTVLGGYLQGPCVAECGSYSVSCSGTDCSATDGVGCKASTTDADGNTTHDDKSCVNA
jgi:hypothetical protein